MFFLACHRYVADTPSMNAIKLEMVAKAINEGKRFVVITAHTINAYDTCEEANQAAASTAPSLVLSVHAVMGMTFSF